MKVTRFAPAPKSSIQYSVKGWFESSSAETNLSSNSLEKG